MASRTPRVRTTQVDPLPHEPSAATSPAAPSPGGDASDHDPSGATSSDHHPSDQDPSDHDPSDQDPSGADTGGQVGPVGPVTWHRRFRRHPWLVAFVVLAAGHLVFIASRTYQPGGDWAFIELRTRDVVSTDPPLTGAWSRYGWNHPGPFLYAALALPHLLTGGSWRGLWVGAMVLNLLAVGVGVWLVARHGRTMSATWAIAALWTVAAAPSLLFTDPWNASIVVLPLLTMAAAVVAVRAGDRRGVAVATVVFVASTQAHAAYGVLLVPAMVVVLAVGVRRWRGWTARWIAVAAALCLPTIVDTLVNWPGNLWRAMRFTATSTEPAVGLGETFRVLGRATSVSFLGDARLPSFVSTVSGTPWGVLPFVALVALAGAHAGSRRWGWTPGRLATEAVALLWLGGFLMTWRTRGPLLIWLTTWTVALAALTWCVVGAVVAHAILRRWPATSASTSSSTSSSSSTSPATAPASPAPSRGSTAPASPASSPTPATSPTSPTSATSAGSPTESPSPTASTPTSPSRSEVARSGSIAVATAFVTLLATSLAVVNVVGSVGIGYPFQELTPVVEQFAADARPLTEGPTPIDLAGDEYVAGAVQSGLIARLEDDGASVLGRPDQALQLGSHRAATSMEGRHLLVQVEPRTAVPAGATVVSTWDPLDAADRAEADSLMDELSALLVSAGLPDRVDLLANDLAPVAAFDAPPPVADRLASFERLGDLHAAGPRIVLYLVEP